MVVIHEHDLRADLAHLIDCRSLDSTACPYWHEYRSLDDPMRCLERTCSGIPVGCMEGEGKIWKSSHKKSESSSIESDYRGKVGKWKYITRDYHQ